MEDSCVIELLAEMSYKLDRVVDAVAANTQAVGELKQATAANTQAITRVEALFNRHLQTLEMEQNNKIHALEKRMEILERKAG